MWRNSLHVLPTQNVAPDIEISHASNRIHICTRQHCEPSSLNMFWCLSSVKATHCDRSTGNISNNESLEILASNISNEAILKYTGLRFPSRKWIYMRGVVRLERGMSSGLPSPERIIPFSPSKLGASIIPTFLFFFYHSFTASRFRKSFGC